MNERKGELRNIRVYCDKMNKNMLPLIKTLYSLWKMIKVERSSCEWGEKREKKDIFFYKKISKDKSTREIPLDYVVFM